MIPLPEFVADALAGRAAALAAHWRVRAAAATPRRLVPPDDHAPDPGLAPSADGSARATRPADLAPAPDTSGTVASDLAETLVAALAASLRKDARPMGEVMRLGWRAGAEAHQGGLSLRHVVRDADLLLAVLLTEVERAVDDRPAGERAPDDATHAVAVARRLHQGTGGFLQAAVSGFVHAFLRALRERYRMLRHDLRNPLGTIQGALSLMEDETVPLEMRHSPQVRAMVARNAGSLDRLIGAGLDDAAATSLLAAPQVVAVADVARAARREVREPARLTGCTIEVDVPETARAQVDGAAFELALTALLLAATAESVPGARVVVGWCPPDAAPADGAEPTAPASQEIVLRLHVEAGAEPLHRASDAPPSAHQNGTTPPDAAGAASGGRWWDEAGLALAASILADHGGRLAGEGISPALPDADAPAALAACPALLVTLPERYPNVDPRAPRRRAADGYLQPRRG